MSQNTNIFLMCIKLEQKRVLSVINVAFLVFETQTVHIPDRIQTP